MNFGRACTGAGRAGVPVTVRIHAVILGPSSGGQGPNNTSLDQIIGEVIIDGVARPLRATTSYHSITVQQALVEQWNRGSHSRCRPSPIS